VQVLERLETTDVGRILEALACDNALKLVSITESVYKLFTSALVQWALAHAS